MRSSPLILAAALLAAPALGAQTPAQALPPELVTALFSGFAPSASHYYVGVVPPSWPAALVPPPPAIVAGGMQIGTRLTAVFVDSAAHHPADSMRKQLEAAGWVRPPEVAQAGFEARGGFQSSHPQYWFWCRDSVRATVASTPGTGARMYVRVNLETMRGQPCIPDPARMQRSRVEALSLPPLPPPPGMRTIGGGATSSDNAIGANTTLSDSTMSAAAVLAHYAGQLVKAGWTTFPPTTTPSFALQPLEARGKDGTAWYGSLIVISSAKARDISLSMMQRSEGQ